MKSNLIRLLTFAAILTSFTYVTIFARNLGISDINIGILVALYSTSIFFSSYIFGRASDRYGRRLFVSVGILVSVIAFFLQIFAYDYVSLLLIRILVVFCIGIFPSALVAYVYELKRNLGKFASFGSLGWCVGFIIAGIIATYFTINGVFILSSLLSLIAFLISLKLEPVKHKTLKIPFFPIKLIRKNLSVYLPILIRHSGAFMIWTFWPLYLQSLGADLFWVGIIQSINSFTQFIVMYTVTDRIKSIKLIKAGTILSGITFFTFALAVNFWYILPTQVLLGLSWAFMYVGALRYVTEKNVEKATVNGMLDSVLNLSSIIGPLLATFVISFVGDYRTTMYIASLLAFISFFVFRVLEYSRKSI